MAAATRTKTPRQRTTREPRKMFMPYEPATAAGPQPPTELAHITDEDELFEALTNAEAYERATGKKPAKWYRHRFIAETGRSEGRFKNWMSNHYAVHVHGADPATIEDRIMVKPDDYDKRSPWWLETTARAWAIAEGLMTRRGVTVPYKPTGRPAGRTDSVPRQRTATMKAAALEVLAEAEQLTKGGMTAGEVKTALARKHGISERAVKRRLTEARAMRRAGIRPITDETTPAEAAEIIVATYRLLMADGRRNSDENARVDVAERLGIDLPVVEVAVNDYLEKLRQLAEPPQTRNFEAEALRSEMEAAIVVDSITRGTKPLHPGT